MARDTRSISIDRVNALETDALMSLYVDLFYDREPLTKSIGFSRERMITVAQTMYARSDTHVLAQGLSWIARDRAEENKDVGFIVCDDPAAGGAQQLPDDLADYELKKVSAVGALLEQIRGPVMETLALGEGICLHVAAVGVAPEYEGAGIATRLLQTALAEAKARGFRYALAECTSPASRQCHERTGFGSLHRISGNSSVVNGVDPLMPPELEIHLMWKVLDEG